MRWATFIYQSILVCRLVAGTIVLMLLLALSEGAAADERLMIDGIHKPVVIARDAEGIVHVYATNEEDLAFAQGWAHARDRLFQMDVFRRRASGTLTELLGKAALADDIRMRTLGIRRAAACSLGTLVQGCPYSPSNALLSEPTVRELMAYAKGVNAYVKFHGLPSEYITLQLQFGEWTALDSVSVAKGVVFSIDQDDLENTKALFALKVAGKLAGFNGPALFFEDVFRSAPFEPVAVIPSKTVGFDAAVGGDWEVAANAPDDDSLPMAAALARSFLGRIHDSPVFQRIFNPKHMDQGSNAWAVSGAKAAARSPILANDPHLDLTTPSLFYPIHLSAPFVGVDVIGDGFAGVPFVATGRNPRVACGITSIALDLSDFFAEQIDYSSLSIKHNPPDNALDQIIPISEIYRDPQGNIIGTSVTLVVPRRNYGPIVDQLTLPNGTDVFLSIQYTGFSGTRELDAFRMMMRANNLQDVRNALQYFDSGAQSFICADSAGNIAYLIPAKVPLREDLDAGAVKGLPPFFVRDGRGGNEWKRLPGSPDEYAIPFQTLPPSEMPQVVNPPEGYIISANNDPTGLNFDNDTLNRTRVGGGIYYISSRFNPGIRAYRIKELLEDQLAEGRVNFGDIRDIQADAVLQDAAFFLPYLIRAFDSAPNSGNQTLMDLASDPALIDAIGRLRIWDRSTPTGILEGYDASDIAGERLPPSPHEQASSVAATIYSVWRGQFIRASVVATLERVGLGDFAPSSQQLMTAARNLLERFPQHKGIGASGLDFLAVAGVDRPEDRRDIVLLKSLKSALELLKSDTFASVFHNSANQADYRWGRLHRLGIDPLPGNPLSLTGDWDGNPFRPPLDGLEGLPVDGGHETVDAANHSSRANKPEDFVFSQGPLRRFVTSFGIAGRTESSLPGGAGGEVVSPYFNNLLGRWLTDDTFRWRRLPLGTRSSSEVVVLSPRR